VELGHSKVIAVSQRVNAREQRAALCETGAALLLAELQPLALLPITAAAVLLLLAAASPGCLPAMPGSLNYAAASSDT
jgi:hypothetical protein